MMKKYWLLIFVLLSLIVVGGGLFYAQTRRIAAAPTVLLGPLEGGCYLETPINCKMFVEPFTIEISPGESLVAFQLIANEQTVYTYSTTQNYRPFGSYTPGLVAQDFAAACGNSYTLTLKALDTGDLDFVTIGQTEPFTCPSADHRRFLPFIER